MRNHLLASVAALTTTAALLAGCSGASSDDAESTPSPSATGTPTASTTPLPKGLKTPPAVPDLSNEEEAAVKQVKAVARDGGAAVARLEADPVSAVADRAGTKRVLSTYYFVSYYGGILDTIDSFANRGLRLVGQSTVRWSVPVKVDLDAATPVVVLEACTTTEDLSIEGQTGDKKITIAPTSISRTTFKAAGGGALLTSWKAERADHVGKC